MRRALDGVAFLPFGRLVDQWRFRAFDGRTKPEDYNASYWQLRRDYQGVAPPLPRTEADFDPGAKYHVPANVPYTRYFIARILQYQFHRALCRVAGHEGPLHRCSIYGSEAAGKKLRAMLRLGASKPWPEALAELSGERHMDARAMIDYYAPLAAYLDEQNRDQSCGWK
jgi:peptidyl-dipeptidase A